MVEYMAGKTKLESQKQAIKYSSFSCRKTH